MSGHAFGYTDIAHAPPGHRIVARLAYGGLPPDAIADAVRISRAEVNRILEHPPIQGHLDTLRQLERNVHLEHMAHWDNAAAAGLNALEAILTDRNAPFPAWFKAVEFIFDRHPSGFFAKRG